jgi:hypothetical protein
MEKQDLPKITMNSKLPFNTWHPINTAPKNATVVDLWVPHRGRLANYVRCDLGKGNIFYNPIESGICVVREATHWMKIASPTNQTPKLFT